MLGGKVRTCLSSSTMLLLEIAAFVDGLRCRGRCAVQEEWDAVLTRTAADREVYNAALTGGGAVDAACSWPPACVHCGGALKVRMPLLCGVGA